MPTYEYVCRNCGTHIEVFQRISDESLLVCPTCGGELRKVFHPAGILLKGSGFYKTDNRQKAKTASSKEPSSSSSSSSESKGSGSSESGSSDSGSGKESKAKEKSA
jgi:putative FmdB family regulatory protein